MCMINLDVLSIFSANHIQGKREQVETNIEVTQIL